MKHLLLLLLLAFTGTSFACKCREVAVKEGVKGADIVASGKVISRHTVVLVDSTITGYPERQLTKYKVLVKQVFKGKTTNDTITLYTGMGGGDCGIDLLADSTYIIYGTKERAQAYNSTVKNIYWTNTCTRTRLYNKAEATEIKKAVKRKKK